MQAHRRLQGVAGDARVGVWQVQVLQSISRAWPAGVLPACTAQIVSHSSFLHFMMTNYGGQASTTVQGELHRWFENCEWQAPCLHICTDMWAQSPSQMYPDMSCLQCCVPYAAANPLAGLGSSLVQLQHACTPALTSPAMSLLRAGTEITFTHVFVLLLHLQASCDPLWLQMSSQTRMALTHSTSLVSQQLA
jgi:hypothetical protein